MLLSAHYVPGISFIAETWQGTRQTEIPASCNLNSNERKQTINWGKKEVNQEACQLVINTVKNNKLGKWTRVRGVATLNRMVRKRCHCEGVF